MSEKTAAAMPLKSWLKLATMGQGKEYFELNALIQSGNLKLPGETAIFNMGSATHCPALAKGLCKAYDPNGKHVCYAMKAERLYKHVLPYRTRQQKFWKRVTAQEFAWQFMGINALRESPWTKLRFNEAGDFHGQRCVEKADEIAMLLKRVGVRVYCYTHRHDLDWTGVRHLVVTASNAECIPGISNTFMMVEDPDKDKPKGWSICPQDCTICDKCSKRGQKIVVKRH